MQLLEQAVEDDPANISAKAMLAVAFFHAGELERYFQLVEDFDEWKPRKEYRDLDQLFLGYATIYIDHLRAAERLKLVLDNRPEWVIPHCLLAIAYAEHTQAHGAPEYLPKAHEAMEVPLSASRRSPLTLMVAQFVNEVAIRMDVDLPNRDERSDEFIKELEGFPEYHAGTIMCAGYYDLVKNRQKALAAWRILLNEGKAFFQSRAMAEFFREGTDIYMTRS